LNYSSNAIEYNPGGTVDGSENLEAMRTTPMFQDVFLQTPRDPTGEQLDMCMLEEDHPSEPSFAASSSDISARAPTRLEGASLDSSLKVPEQSSKDANHFSANEAPTANDSRFLLSPDWRPFYVQAAGVGAVAVVIMCIRARYPTIMHSWSMEGGLEYGKSLCEATLASLREMSWTK
jgi:hypothetical protein